MKERIHLNKKGLHGTQILRNFFKKRLKTSKAAHQQGLSEKQVKRLKSDIRTKGRKGANIEKSRSSMEPGEVPEEEKALILSFLNVKGYWDFEPTLIHE